MEGSKFDLVGLMTTVFQPKAGERVGVFIDLEDPQAVQNARFRWKVDQFVGRSPGIGLGPKNISSR